MKPIEFPEQNTVFAKDQKEYLPLPAFTNGTETISCWKFTWRERIKILFGKPLWLRQYNFGQALQPQLPTIEFPFEPGKPKS